jgi:signal transduction histidine kinase
MAHEFASPLNAITMNAEALKLLIERDDAARAALRTQALIADCVRCARLLEGYRRFGAGMSRTSAACEQAAIGELIDAADALFAGGTTRPAIEGLGGASVFVDRTALAFAELLRNAADAGAAKVLLVIEEGDAAVAVDFFDDGAGIASDVRDKVLMPFFSTRRSEGRPGLGLSLAQELLRANNATLRIGPEIERGTCMRVSFDHLPTTG